MTIVAAWMSADTGVGPSMASSSQACSGNCADLPQAASRSSRPIAVKVPSLAWLALPKTSEKVTDPKVTNMSMIASPRPTSPTRLMMKAFLAAAAAVGLTCQKPMSRYDARPTPSQPTYSSRKLFARTRISIAATNRFR